MQAQVKSAVIYRFPAFTEGTVVFRNGSISTQKLNYNIELDEMQFIAAHGDTLSIADPVTINYISINDTRFYFEKGYLQTIKTAGDIILAFKQELIEEEQKKGAYGIPTDHPSAKTYESFTGNGQKYVLGGSEIEVNSRAHYFFGDQYGHFTKAGREYILDHYKKHQEEIKVFMKTNHTNFNKEEDLLQLLQYCSQLVL
jgi:hypothetical protein